MQGQSSSDHVKIAILSLASRLDDAVKTEQYYIDNIKDFSPGTVRKYLRRLRDDEGVFEMAPISKNSYKNGYRLTQSGQVKCTQEVQRSEIYKKFDGMSNDQLKEMLMKIEKGIDNFAAQIVLQSPIHDKCKKNQP